MKTVLEFERMVLGMQAGHIGVPAHSARESVRDMTKMAICVAFCCVTAYLSFPLPFTPGMVTALTVALSVTALVLPPRQTFLVILAYILLGAAGLPVFASASGISRLLGPAGGFYFAWLLAFPLLSLFKGKTPNFRRYALMNILVAIPITDLGGLISMMLLLDVSLWQAMGMAVFPFLLGDVLKACVAAFLGVKLNHAMEKH